MSADCLPLDPSVGWKSGQIRGTIYATALKMRFMKENIRNFILHLCYPRRDDKASIPRPPWAIAPQMKLPDSATGYYTESISDEHY